MNLLCVQLLSFFDPPLTSSGEPFGPLRYREIVKERYYIAKQGNISYTDTGKMTPTERELVISYILEELQARQNMINQISKA